MGRMCRGLLFIGLVVVVVVCAATLVKGDSDECALIENLFMVEGAANSCAFSMCSADTQGCNAAAKQLLALASKNGCALEKCRETPTPAETCATIEKLFTLESAAPDCLYSKCRADVEGCSEAAKQLLEMATKNKCELQQCSASTATPEADPGTQKSDTCVLINNLFAAQATAIDCVYSACGTDSQGCSDLAKQMLDMAKKNGCILEKCEEINAETPKVPSSTPAPIATDTPTSDTCALINSLFSAQGAANDCVYAACGADSQACSDLAQQLLHLAKSNGCFLEKCKEISNNDKDNTSNNDNDKDNTSNNDDDNNAPPFSGEVMVGTYLPNWFVYRKHYMGIENLDADPTADVGDPTDDDQQWTFFASQLVNVAPKLTHVFYAFYDLSEDCIVTDRDPDASWYGKEAEPGWIHTPEGACAGLINQLLSLQTQFPHLKILISVGGWTYSQHFSACAATAENRMKVIKSFDFYANAMDPNWGKPTGRIAGVDFDWEHPAVADGLHPDHADDDWSKYVLLVNEFRSYATQAGRSSAQITSAVGVGSTLKRLTEEFPDEAKKFCKGLDHINLMTYDMHGKWVGTTGHNAPFCGDEKSNAQPDPALHWSVKEVTEKLGNICGYAKINLGIPNYAPAWTDVPDNGVDGLYQTSTDSTRFARWSTFSENDTTLNSQGQVHFWDMEKLLQKYRDLELKTSHECTDLGVTVPVKFVYSSQRQIFASYEPTEVVEAKAKWAKARGLGGFFFWDASQDREGATLDAARKGWGGLPSHAGGGAATCYDSNKPDYSADPLTGEEVVVECRNDIGTKYTVVSGDTCWNLGQSTAGRCGSTSYPVGGTDGTTGQCKRPCAIDWGAAEGLNVGDTINYVCNKCEVDGSCSGDQSSSSSDGTEQPAADGGGASGKCDVTSTNILIVKSNDYCDLLRQAAESKCNNSPATFVGSFRSGSAECLMGCSSTWGESPTGAALWANDLVFYSC